MDLRVLTYFLTVAREKTISQAAESLHLSQPTLSKQLKELEEELGVTLFIRGNREITLTEDGIYLRNRGEEILSLVNKTTSNLKGQSVIGGNLSIGAGETKVFKIIAETISEMTRNYPDVYTQFYSGNSDDIMRKIDDGLLDFGLVIGQVAKQKYESITLPEADVWGLMLNKQHKLANNKFISPKNLLNTPLYTSSQSLVDQQMSDWLGVNSTHLNIVGSYNLLYNASLLSETGQAAVLCIDGIINTTGTNLTFIELLPRLEAKSNLIWKKDVVLSNTAKMFLKELKGKINNEIKKNRLLKKQKYIVLK